MYITEFGSRLAVNGIHVSLYPTNTARYVATG